jgi:hypothetical protein
MLKPAIKAGIALAVGETWDDVLEYYSVSISLRLEIYNFIWLGSSMLTADPRSNHILAMAGSCLTPSPLKYIRPRYAAIAAAYPVWVPSSLGVVDAC